MSIRDEKLTDMTEAAIEKDMGELTFSGSPLYMACITELSRRQMKKLEDATKTMNESIVNFSASSDKYSKKLVWLTWLLVACTVALLYFTYILIRDAKEQALSQNNIALNSVFFNDDNLEIINTIEGNRPILRENYGAYTDTQLDNYLGTFDVIESSYEKELLSEADLCDSFSYYVKITSKNSEIQNYISNQQKVDKEFFVSLANINKIILQSRNQNCR